VYQGSALAYLYFHAGAQSAAIPVATGGVVGTLASDGGSLYEPPDGDGMSLSQGYHSYGDTDDLGSVGMLQAELGDSDM
jgi:hypothetical protein